MTKLQTDVWQQALRIVDETNQNLNGDLATLFRIDNNRLVLVGPMILGGKRTAADPRYQYELSGPGITAAVAARKEFVAIDSYTELANHPAHAGKWDAFIYGEKGPGDSDTGFGCLLASPVLAASKVAGVFKVERRRSRPVFSQAERDAFLTAVARVNEILSGSATADSRIETPARTGVSLKEVERGFASLNPASGLAEAALENLGRWLDGPEYREYRPQLDWLIQTKQWSVLLNSFYQILPFGTGGRRGPVGIGSNRFNPESLKASLIGHIKYLMEIYPDKDLQDLSVVVAYDVRDYRDLRRVYNADLPNPLIGLTSKKFAHTCADFYAAYGVSVYILPPDSPAYMSTPELSFFIRRLGASGGLNISASHNHPDDNGGKFFGAHGGQEVPPNDQKMADMAEFENPAVPLADVRKQRALNWIPAGLHQEYIDLNLKQSLNPAARVAKIVFTSLHGTGRATVGELLPQAGFEMIPVAEQWPFDGAFPTVPFRAPNPEVPESMSMGVELARKVQADAVMSCDPDADRLGLYSADGNGGYRFVNGNEIATLVTHYKLDALRRQNRLPKRPLVLKTEVTTNLLRAITEDFGGTMLGDFLVGFKYLGNVLNDLEYGGGDHPGLTLADFVLATEESHGILVTSEMRDKDAGGAAVLLAELTAELRSANRTLVDYLDEIYLRYGYYSNRVVSMVMSGAEGSANIQKIQAALRAKPPSTLGQMKVTKTVDHRDVNGIYGPSKSASDWEARNVLVFEMGGGARAIIRPSGTEPKNKTYIEVHGEPLGINAGSAALEQQKAQVNSIAQTIADDLTRQMLSVIGVELPTYALRISGLVNLEKKISFVRDFIPELEARVTKLLRKETSEEDVSKWIDQTLWSYGEDGRKLVADAIATYIAVERAKTASSPDAGRERGSHLDLIAKFFAKPV